MASIIDKDSIRGRRAVSQGTGGGAVDDILRRLGTVESLVTETRIDVGAIKAVLPHLATQARLNEVEGSLNARINDLEARLIKWIVRSTLASASLAASLAFLIARFVHVAPG